LRGIESIGPPVEAAMVDEASESFGAEVFLEWRWNWIELMGAEISVIDM
jgi:hypothetical protein